MSHILQNHYCACSSLRCGLVTITVNSAIFKVKKILRVIVVGLLFNTNQSIRLLIGQYRVFRQVLVTLPNLTKFYLTQLSFGKQTRSLICSPQGQVHTTVGKISSFSDMEKKILPQVGFEPRTSYKSNREVPGSNPCGSKSIFSCP